MSHPQDTPTKVAEKNVKCKKCYYEAKSNQ